MPRYRRALTGTTYFFTVVTHLRRPVKHGLVSAVADWPYSTFCRYVRAGVYPDDWGGNPVCDGMEFEQASRLRVRWLNARPAEPATLRDIAFMLALRLLPQQSTNRFP